MELIEGGAETRTLAESKKEYPRVLAPTAREGEKCPPIKLFASTDYNHSLPNFNLSSFCTAVQTLPLPSPIFSPNSSKDNACGGRTSY